MLFHDCVQASHAEFEQLYRLNETEREQTYVRFFVYPRIRFNGGRNECKGRLIFLSGNTASLCSGDKSNLHWDN